MQVPFSDWSEKVGGFPISAVSYPAMDRSWVFAQFHQWAELPSLGQGNAPLPVFFWSPGCTTLYQVKASGELSISPEVAGELRLETVEAALTYLFENPAPGIFLLEGVLDLDRSGQISPTVKHQVCNAYFQLRALESPCYWVLLGEYVDIPPELQAFAPKFVYALIDTVELRGWLRDRFEQEVVPQVIRACQGLSVGELTMLFEANQAELCQDIQGFVERVSDYKLDKLTGLGLHYMAEPDIPYAPGQELLEQRLDEIAALLSPEAGDYNLNFPKGMFLWGPPGTGKSLGAKLAARRLNLPLISLEWGAILGVASPDIALSRILSAVESIAPCILYFDDFDKGFAGWDSDADGGVARRLAGKLLVWLQEHRAAVYTIATVNRMAMLPPELKRRLDEAFFMDYPHNGARHEILKAHLTQYFAPFQAADPWSERQWRNLLTMAQNFSPAEIGGVVRRLAERKFYELYQAGLVDADGPPPLETAYEELLLAFRQTIPLKARPDGQEQVEEMQQNRDFAKPAAAPDRSVFAKPENVRLYQCN